MYESRHIHLSHVTYEWVMVQIQGPNIETTEEGATGPFAAKIFNQVRYNNPTATRT